MGIGDYVDKAKQALAGNEDKAADALDKAADAIKARTSDSTDAKVDQVVDKAKDFLEKK
ncbi:MAG TPA: Rv0909 family putative TA system antitoxin [Cellulomonas sp.]